MVKSISVLGCTGSIGRQTLAVARHTGIRVAAMTANRQIDLLEEQARLFRPEFVAVYDEQAAAELKTALRDTDIRVGSGMEGLLEAATLEQIDCVVTAVSGAVGLRPTLAAIERKKRIALANKETLVCAGEIVMKRAAETGAEIIPVDSEHSAVFQCLMGRQKGELRRILLTCSGGPFRGRKREELEAITPAQAVKHPRWNMGAKISVVYLENYILVCSAEPCVMCSGAIKWAKIGQIFYSVPQSEINRISGGRPKPSCESLINSGTSQKLIVGKILLDEGLKVFEGYRFTPQDQRSK